jgi:NADH-quinone oxidoreductase subunit J
MDYALLAATALGAIGLYLMLPRDKAPLARLGGLLSAMALVGLFLYLVRTVAAGSPTGGGNGPPAPFYLFAFIMIAGAVGVVCQSKPVYAALYFVLVTLAGAGIFVLLLAEFMAIVLIIIYAGAILVTYIFVIMLASQGSTGAVGGGGVVAAPEYDRRAAEPFISVFVAFLLIGTILQVLFPTHGRTIAQPAITPEPLMAASLDLAPPLASADTTVPTTQPAAAIPPTNVQVLGANLYSQYSLSLELAGILLTIALVGAVVIARKNTTAESALLGTGELPAE